MDGKPPQGAPCQCTMQLHMLEPGVVQVATFSVPSIQLEGATLVMNVQHNRLEMRARCGCFVEVPLTRLLLDVAEMSRNHAPVLN